MKMLPIRQTVWLLFVPIVIAAIGVMAFQLQTLREDVRQLQVCQTGIRLLLHKDYLRQQAP